MTKGGSQFMFIKVDTETGMIVEPPEDENGKKATQVSSKEIDEIYNDKIGFKYVGTILHAHNSPGCVYLTIGGRTYKICW